MIVFYGFVARDRAGKSGAFACPNCFKNRSRKHRNIESWLSLFFVPVFAGR
jgi:hypothetical protein